MATYYVDYNNGSDSNNGLGPDASHATNKPWKTIGKLLGASGMASGDTAYLAPGVFRERVTVAMTSATVETLIIGDPLNTQGFKTSGGVLVAPAPVIHTPFETSDTAAPSASTATLILSGRDYLTFRNLTIIAGQGSAIQADTNTSTNCKFQDCAIVGGGTTNTNLVLLSAAANVALNWEFTRCIFVSFRSAIMLSLTATRPSGADFDVAVTIQNCTFLHFGSSRCIYFNVTGANSFNPGGIDILNCTFLGAAGSSIIETVTNTSTSVPAVTCYNSILMGGATGMTAATSGQITEDYNLIACTTARSNVTAGSNSVSNGSRAVLLEYGQSLLHGFRALAPLTPYLDGCGLDGWGGTSVPTTDLLNRIRPAGGESTSAFPGALERHDTARQETSTVDAGSSGLVLVGPADHSIFVPVNAESTTISIKARYDTNHAATNKPQAILQANAKIGVSTETKTMTSGVDTWETLTFSAFTPSAKGVVEIRLISRAAAGNGKAFFDTVSVS